MNYVFLGLNQFAFERNKQREARKVEFYKQLKKHNASKENLAILWDDKMMDVLIDATKKYPEKDIFEALDLYMSEIDTKKA